MSNILEMTNLSIEDNIGNHLLYQVNIAVREAKVNVLIGESGSGKSLTAKALVQHIPSTLKMQYDSLKYQNKDIKDIQQLLGMEIGFISQDYTHCFNDHTKLGKQLISIYRQHHKVSKADAQQHVIQALEWVDLVEDEIMHKYRFNLSGGQLARVQIASVLMLKPSIIIMDEPTASLDAITGYHVMQLIKHLAEVHKVTLLLITHNLAHVLDFSDWIHVMQHGAIIESKQVLDFKEGNITAYSLELFNARSQLKKENADDSTKEPKL
ncbi:ATP-binding cassette domain-containing protein [Staphylococcus caeli]|uniref:ATP-binding cassette domain-containing protein n=1 Tax=Staphylococcus caeli TaxID=2201815 RepID=UPI003F563A3B